MVEPNQPLYAPVDARVSWPEMEQRVLAGWKESDVFGRSVERNSSGPRWTFYEGPPTANGRPGIHHVESRTFKDVFCRYKTMRGFYVPRKAGWDCHGLPVEIEVEKELGIIAKHEIEDRIGIEKFTRRCRESVQRYVADWSALTDRIAFWVDLDGAYWTMSADYIESVWWVLRQIWDAGLLEEDFKVVPYCPRCETSLSSHEQHQPGAYRTVVDPSVYVRFPLEDTNDSLLIWTTTPWTLLSNLAAAVGEDIVYARVNDPGRPGAHLILAADRVKPLFGEGAEVLATMKGAELIDVRYEPPFGFVQKDNALHRVRPGDFVTTDDGSGIVHLAPYGEDDMMVAKRDGLPIIGMIDGSGRVIERGEPFAGLRVKDADPKIVEDLDSRGLLLKVEEYEHSYPHCWRCGTPLLYYPRKDWYIRTSRIRDRLQASNESTRWYPETIKYGRFGDWLANNVDWSLSRDRYWGTPLPVWRCEDEHVVCVGSFAELADLAGHDLSGLDPHRPYVDEITFPCPDCGKRATRVASVIDTWFDSGSMPFGQLHYPFEGSEGFEEVFPADFITEAIDQTRGWFYSLLAVSTLVRGENSYRNVVCLGHIVDTRGRKMSKSEGNVIDPWEVLDAQGADALRWYMLTGGNPWAARRMSSEIVEEVLRKYLLTLWHTYSFWVTYASLEGFDPTTESIPVAARSEMDRWILAEMDDAVREVTYSLEDFDTPRAGRRIDRFVDDLSNWYVRRCRRRFWRSREDADTRAAFLTLWECLVTTARLTAPFTPFVADAVFSNLTGVDPGLPDSVHLADWPVPSEGLADDALRRRMRLARRLTTLGRAARTEAGIKVRQPLATAYVVVPAAQASDLEGLEGLVAEELNVKALVRAEGLSELVDYRVKPNFKALGPRFGSRMKEVSGAIMASDPAALVHQIEGRGAASVNVGGEEVSLTRDDLDIRVEGREGFALLQDGPYGVALDVELTGELVAEGVAREVIRGIQELRKASGLAVEDRIELWLAPAPDTEAAVREHEDLIGREVLSIATHVGEPAPERAHSAEIKAQDGVVSAALLPARV